MFFLQKKNYKSSFNNNKAKNTSNKRKRDDGESGDDRPDPNKNRSSNKKFTCKNYRLIQSIAIIWYLRDRVIYERTRPNYLESGHRYYGAAPGSLVVTLRQMIHYALSHPNEIFLIVDTPINFILSDLALSRFGYGEAPNTILQSPTRSTL